MITEDQLEQLAIQWFQNTGWNYVGGTVISPEGEEPERENFRAVVLKGRLADAVSRLNPKLPPDAMAHVVQNNRATGKNRLQVRVEKRAA